MNAVEIEEAVSRLAAATFDPEEFPFAFLEAFGNKATTIKRLRSGSSNQSDLPGGVLQRNNIHLKVCGVGEVTATLTALRESGATARQKVKFILATDGQSFEAESLEDGETIACEYPRFADHFGFFLPLAGITTVRQIRENAFDIKATGRLNRLYVELLKENPEWDRDDRREAMNHFMARLIFCFFAEDTNIFPATAKGEGLFTATIAQMSAGDASNTHEVMAEIFRSMCTPLGDRAAVGVRSWASGFPYVNGGLFSGDVEVPRFSKVARSYLLHVGSLDWKQINPDIFGSMIQAIAEEEERGTLGMHYTSVPNILKVLNPLFLDDLRSQLEGAGDNARKLLNLRQRLAKIRVFDPACGSGNFLVIAYKEMRAIEAEINRRRGEPDRRSEIPLTNFRGIEIRHFACEIARLALIIAEYQCDVLYRGPKLALAEFLPLKNDNWITCGNALRLDWLSVCPPTGTGVRVQRQDLDLWEETREVAEIEFENEGGETYICGNPQFKGARKQTKAQKEDMSLVFDGHKDFKDCDYVTAWFLKAAKFSNYCDAKFAFVSTSSISQGEQVAHLWSRLYKMDYHIIFAHQGFKWKNNAANNAGVHCVIIGIGRKKPSVCKLYNEETMREVESISPYLTLGSELYVQAQDRPIYCELGNMVMGSMARDGGNLLLTREEATRIIESYPSARYILKEFVGSQELIHYRNRYCIWIEDADLDLGTSIPEIAERINRVREFRKNSSAKTTNGYASIPHKFAQRAHNTTFSIGVAKTSSEVREFLPADFFTYNTVISDAAFAIYAPSIWELSIVLSKMHMVWIASICGKLETRLRYSSTLGWNTFPVPILTEHNKLDLTRCAEDILLAREHYFPATIADMYDPDRMDSEFPLVREAHDRNDETIERIYIGRRFKNDTERLEKLFDLYTKMTQTAPKNTAKRQTKGAKS